MKKVLPNIINYDQTAYVKNRYIGESIRVIDDILYHAEQENLDGLCLLQVWKKHLIHWNITLSSQPFARFGFGQEFIQWIRTIFAEWQ